MNQLWRLSEVDLSSLEQNHVFPNVGDIMARGIWFPQGYDEPVGKE
jgi:hypothetical protein